ncbi:MAG: VIT and vWA domain-containing protein [Planctomycetota bacterium]|jgi:Ca-activated chloride channel family protein
MRNAFLALCLGLLALPSAAQGLITETINPDIRRRRPPTRQIRLVEHTVNVVIDQQAARTDVVQVFQNDNTFPMEGVYLFPLPRGAVIGDFTMSMGGKQVQGELLSADKARDIYLSIVRRRRDPGLLEYAGRGLIRARMFPIPARGKVKVTMSFNQVLTSEGGLVEYRYPLRSNKFAPGPVKISGRIEVRSKAGIATVFSPSHKLDVARQSEDAVVASFEESRSAADRDLQFMFGLGRKNFGLSLMTHKPVGADGYFLMLLSPGAAAAAGRKADVMPKDIVFVLDTSGSMGDRGGEKIRQAKAALGYALGRLDPRDRFNVIAFSTEARPFRTAPVEATRENVAAAIEHVKGLRAAGGTAIHAAMLQALKLERADGRIPIVIFLTDGQPTIGPTSVETIVGDSGKANGAKARVFVFGVGDDVNATLLTRLADSQRGSANFVAESENIEHKVGGFYDKVASPVLADVEVTIGDVGQYDVYPRRLGDLFKGQQVVVVGRFKQSGPRAVTLRGKLGAETVSYVYEGSFDDKAKHEFLPRLWAVRKVGFLLEEIRRNGEKTELVNEVKALATRHGIVTPYTSYLVVEEGELRRRGRQRRPGTPSGGVGAAEAEADEALDRAGREAKKARGALGSRQESGGGAVAGAKLAGRLKKADDTRGVAGVGVKTVGAKTFRLKDGVWIDVAIDDLPAVAEPRERRVVTYLSDEYIALLADDTLARYLSVGEKVRLLYGGVIYEVG